MQIGLTDMEGNSAESNRSPFRMVWFLGGALLFAIAMKGCEASNYNRKVEAQMQLTARADISTLYQKVQRLSDRVQTLESQNEMLMSQLDYEDN